MISKKIVEEVDEILDDNVSEMYQDMPLGQDWARVAKIGEEMGEAINELILLTGQNPRKPVDEGAYYRLLNELADVAMTGVYAIQHFTKDIDITEVCMMDAQKRHQDRLREIDGKGKPSAQQFTGN